MSNIRKCTEMELEIDERLWTCPPPPPFTSVLWLWYQMSPKNAPVHHDINVTIENNELLFVVEIIMHFKGAGGVREGFSQIIM